MNLLEKTIAASGYNSTEHFTNSTFHPDSIGSVAIATGVSTGIAFYVESFLGVQMPAILVVLGFFILELFTGIRASFHEGYGWSTTKFGKGFLKLAVYAAFVGFTNILALYGPIETYFGYEFNHYRWLHYIFANFVIFNYILSNLENFVRLGWEDRFGVITKIAKMFNLQVLKIKKERDERKISK